MHIIGVIDDEMDRYGKFKTLISLMIDHNSKQLKFRIVRNEDNTPENKKMILGVISMLLGKK